MIDYRPISKVNFNSFTAAFNLAYSDYFVPISMTSPAFQSLIERDSIDLDCSVAAVENDQIIGTGLLGIRDHYGWIGGMGVVPSRRHQGIGRQMMLHLLTCGRERGLQRIDLEVIEANHAAYSLYKQLGFVDHRYLIALESDQTNPIPLDPRFQIVSDSAASLLAHYPLFHDQPNCWQRSLPALQVLAPQMDAYAALENGEVVGYGAGWMNDSSIRLLDIATHPAHDRGPIAASILAFLHHEFPAAHGNAVNISAGDPALAAFESLGYKTFLRQIEMQFYL
ncbi:MAG TPA: GNAT family N-acetyltransferase [Aggregatilineaceae bacterium]|nr:GNAT family N-acetyltransferase [Aggregatilineaceae bacterium]